MFVLLSVACRDAPPARDDTDGFVAPPDPCDVPGNICTWLGVPDTAMFSGEGTDRSADPASGTFLFSPTDIAFTADGTAYYVDRSRIRRVSAFDVVTTISGTLSPGGGNDACWDGCTASTASWLNGPLAVAVDASDPRVVWVAAHHLGLVARIDVLTDTLTWVSDTFTPGRLVSHPDGSVFVTDLDAELIRRITPDGTVEVVGPSPSGLALEDLSGLALDGELLLIADTDNGLVRSIDLAACVGDLASCRTSDVAVFQAPWDVAAGPDGAVYVADAEENCVWVVRDGVVAPLAGRKVPEGGYDGDGGPATEALLENPFGVAVDSSGDVFVADTGNHIIRRVVVP